MEKYTIVPAVCLLVERDGHWFVGRRQNTGYCDGHLNMPAGHIDPDETPREAAVREAKEEVGIDVHIDDITFVHVQYNRNRDGFHDRTHYYYHIKYEGADPANMEPHKCSEVKWIPAFTELDDFVPFMGEALTALEAGNAYSEFYEEK